MLIIDVPEREIYDTNVEEFFSVKATRLTLEHSLLSVKKWESVWKRSLLKALEKKDLSVVEFQDYIRCMTINQNVDLNIYRDPMSATTFSNTDPNANKGKNETITAELIYWWMASNQIPFECEKWHLNQLMNLLHIAAIKNGPQKKMNKRDVMRRNGALNAARRAKMGTKG